MKNLSVILGFVSLIGAFISLFLFDKILVLVFLIISFISLTIYSFNNSDEVHINEIPYYSPWMIPHQRFNLRKDIKDEEDVDENEENNK